MLKEVKETLSESVARWLTGFERALAGSDDSALQGLFLPDAHWRDLLALTWNVKTVSGAQQISKALRPHGAGSIAAANATLFTIDTLRTPPRRVTRAGMETIEAFFRFETGAMRAQGLLRLHPEAGRDGIHQAWTLFTAAEELKGFEENIGSRRPRGESYSRDFQGPNWQDLRRASALYADRDPEVLIVGGGHAGLSIAARLRHLNVDTLIVDREARVGDNWRTRYHALTLHNQVQVNHLPYIPFPASWPSYIPKDKLANWFEAYVESLELNFWTHTEFTGGHYDDASRRWNVSLRCADGSIRTMQPRHVVMATSVSGVPNVPEIPILKNFTGKVMHSSQYSEASEWKERDVIVIGTGTSGHDIAQDLASNGARVTLVQRSPTLIVNIEPAAQLPYALYSEGLPTDECDFIAASMPLALSRQSHRTMALQAAELDRQLIDDLKRSGFEIDEDDVYGWQFKYLTRGGGYYFNVGCSNLIVDGKVSLKKFADIERFDGRSARMRNGDTVPADLVVLATGYKGMDALIRKLFGDATAERTGPVWGIDEDAQELRNMWTRTGQPGLWFIAGSFAQCRIYSKFLAMQIKAQIEGLITSSI
jgi:cation diffusion facilitator CzcD-associated flavoprotein CzcO